MTNEEGVNLIEYAVDNEQRLETFCLKLKDEMGELWRADFVPQEGSSLEIMQIRLAREQRRATAEQNLNFRVPWVLRQLLKEGYGGSC